MKTTIEFPVVKTTRTNFLMWAIVLSLFFALTNCSDDDDQVKPDTSSLFIGAYAVQDSSKGNGNVYYYDITISNGTDGNVNISNFADMFNIPVKATIDGNKITIKTQSFTNPSSGNTIKVWGDGTLTGDVLNFNYTTEGYLDYSGICKASKKQ